MDVDFVKTSLLVPCYNAERFIPRLKAQVGALSPAFDEVILVDDGSTDATVARARAAGFRIESLGMNRGPGAARNELARLGSGDWIHFHDVDDEIVPDYLAHVAPRADGSDAVFHDVDFLNEETRGLMIRWQLDAAAILESPAETLLSFSMPTMSSFLKRGVFLSLGGFNESRRCFEDGDLHFRLAVSGARLAYVSEVLELSLKHPEGAGSDAGYCFECRLEFLKDYASGRPAPGLALAIARQAEAAAVQLLRVRKVRAAKEALDLAASLGLKVPTSNHYAIRLMRGFLPRLWVLQWQLKARGADRQKADWQAR